MVLESRPSGFHSGIELPTCLKTTALSIPRGKRDYNNQGSAVACVVWSLS